MRSTQLESTLRSARATLRSAWGIVRSASAMVRSASAMVRSACAMVRIGAGAALAARVVLLGRALFYLLVMTILGKFWNAVAADNAGGIVNLPAGIVLYVGIAECTALSVPAIHLRLEDDIRSGAIEAHLLRPMPYLLARVSETIGGMAVRLGVLGLVGVVLLAASDLAAPPVAAWPAIGVLAALGGTVHVLLVTIAGLSAFWLRRCITAWLVLQKLTFLLGGLFAPVTLYPAWLARIAVLSPFAASLYWPAVIALRPDAVTILTAFVAVLAWIVLLALVCAAIWRAGMCRLLTRGV
jgi:ABC-type uncharacterized transport system permease subunit